MGFIFGRYKASLDMVSISEVQQNVQSLVCHFHGQNSRGGSRGRVQGVHTPPEITCGFLIQLVFCKKKTMWFIGVEVEQETSAPPPKKNPGSALETLIDHSSPPISM